MDYPPVWRRRTGLREAFVAYADSSRYYFVTESGKKAGMRLMDLYLEAGEFPAAAWMGDWLLKSHPNLVVERPAVLYRTAVAYHLEQAAHASLDLNPSDRSLADRAVEALSKAGDRARRGIESRLAIELY